MDVKSPSKPWTCSCPQGKRGNTSKNVNYLLHCEYPRRIQIEKLWPEDRCIVRGCEQKRIINRFELLTEQYTSDLLVLPVNPPSNTLFIVQIKDVENCLANWPLGTTHMLLQIVRISSVLYLL